MSADSEGRTCDCVEKSKIMAREFPGMPSTVTCLKCNPVEAPIDRPRTVTYEGDSPETKGGDAHAGIDARSDVPPHVTNPGPSSEGSGETGERLAEIRVWVAENPNQPGSPAIRWLLDQLLSAEEDRDYWKLMKCADLQATVERLQEDIAYMRECEDDEHEHCRFVNDSLRAELEEATGKTYAPSPPR